MSAFADPGRLYFFLDYISHNAWLAWNQAPALAARHGLTLTPVPVLFGAMLSHYRQVGPAELPVKSSWMLRNVLRKARLHGIPIAPPASHPFNPLLALRVTCAIDDEPARTRAVDRLFRATWAEGRAVNEPEVVRALLLEIGLPADALMAAAGAETAKQRLRENTDGGLAQGLFGVPSAGQIPDGSSDAAAATRRTRSTPSSTPAALPTMRMSSSQSLLVRPLRRAATAGEMSSRASHVRAS
jgi:2-hydroxychromene-2-carboxylate isomerase